jgi:hypothetical protein
MPERVTGGFLPPLPPRTAALAADGRFGGYAPLAANATAPLEGLIAAFLAQPAASGAAAQRPVDDQTREALRALGYLE